MVAVKKAAHPEWYEAMFNKDPLDSADAAWTTQGGEVCFQALVGEYLSNPDPEDEADVAVDSDDEKDMVMVDYPNE